MNQESSELTVLERLAWIAAALSVGLLCAVALCAVSLVAFAFFSGLAHL